jgi:hypothetical protein
MSFKLNLSIFKSTKPDSKVDFTGMMNIKVEELDALCRFVMSQTPDQYGSVQVPISGWKKTSQKGLAYVSAVAQPPRTGWILVMLPRSWPRPLMGWWLMLRATICSRRSSARTRGGRSH